MAADLLVVLLFYFIIYFFCRRGAHVNYDAGKKKQRVHVDCRCLVV